MNGFAGMPMIEDARALGLTVRNPRTTRFLSAIASLLRPKDERDPAAAERLRAIIAGTPILETDLDGYLAAQDQATAQLRRAMAAREAVNAAQVEKDKESWRRFEAHLRSDPSLLSDPKNLGSWKAGLFRFHFLMQWLQRRSHSHDEKALRDWRLLEEGFGRAVAEAFRDGLRQLWRISRPRRPKPTVIDVDVLDAYCCPP